MTRTMPDLVPNAISTQLWAEPETENRIQNINTRCSHEYIMIVMIYTKFTILIGYGIIFDLRTLVFWNLKFILLKYEV